MRIVHWFAAVLLCVSALSAASDGGLRRLQRAYFETARAELTDLQNGGCGDEQPAEGIPVAMPALKPFPRPVVGCMDGVAWDIALVLAAISLGLCAVDGLFCWRRWRNSPRQRSLLEACRCLRQFTAGEVSLSLAVEALRQRLELPPGTTLSQVADAVQNRLPKLAEACRTLELARWSNGQVSHAAIRAFTAALKPLLMAAVLFGLTACVSMSAGVTKAFSDWSHGRKLAADGMITEALAVFLRLASEMPSSPELSQNIAALLTVLPASSGGDALASPQAWTLHGNVRRNAFQPYGDGSRANALPEICLAVLVPLGTLCVLMLCHHRRAAGASAAVLAVVAAVVLGVSLRPRLALVRQVVAAPGAVLRLTPDEDGEPVIVLQEAALAELDEEYPACNGFRRISLGGDRCGWMAQRHYLTFRLSGTADAAADRRQNGGTAVAVH